MVAARDQQLYAYSLACSNRSSCRLSIKLQHAILLIHAGRADVHELSTEGNPTLPPFAALITWRFSIGMFAMFS
jgi:hypothetical protein